MTPERLRRVRGIFMLALGLVATPTARAHARAVTQAVRPAVVDALDRSTAAPLGPTGGTVDWTQRVLRSRGHSAGPIGAYLPPDVAPYAQRRAESLAQDGLMQLLRATPLSNRCTVGDAVAQDPTLGALIYAATQSMQVTRAIYDAQGGVALEVELPLDTERDGLGALWSALGARNSCGGAASEPLAPQAAEAAGQASTPAAAPAPEANTALALSSGIVVNARGTGFVPSVWPRIMGADGTLLYGRTLVPPDVLVLRGLMGATRSLEVAMADARVAPMPQVISARGTLGDDPHTLVLAEDAARTFAALQELVSDARVVVVVD